MMRTRLPLFLVAALVFLGGLWFLSSGHSLRSDAASPGLEEPDDREEWLRARLADPRTGEIPSEARESELALARTLPVAGHTARGPALTFESVGPVGVGGRTRALAVDRSAPDIVIAGAVSGGIWRSTDRGQTWGRTTGVDQPVNVTAVVQDVRLGRQETWYAGTGEGTGSASGIPGAGILRSIDGGRTWAQWSKPNPGDATWGLAVHPTTDADVVFAAMQNGVHRSSDGARTWQRVLPAQTATEVVVTASGTVYATTGGYSDGALEPGVWRSSDAGASWQEITPPDMPAVMRRGVLGLAPSDESVLYLLADTPQGTCGSTNTCPTLWKLTDGPTAVWENRSDNLTYTTGSRGITIEKEFRAQRYYDLEVAVRPDDADVVYLGGIPLVRSTDGFASTANTTDITNHHADQHAVVFDPDDPGRFYIGSDGGVHLATDDLEAVEQPWEFDAADRNEGYVTSQFYTVTLDATPGETAIMGGTQDNGTWIYDGQRRVWDLIGGGDGAFAAFTPDYYYISSQNGSVTRRRRTPTGWEGFRSIEPAGAGSTFFIHPFAIDPSDSNVMYYPARASLWINTRLDEIRDDDEFGTPAPGWERLIDDRSTESGRRISAVAVAPVPAHRVYVGTADGDLFRIDDATSGAPTITVLADPIPRQTSTYTSSIAIDPEDGNHVVVTYSNYGIPSVFESQDGGASWTAIEGNLGTASDPEWERSGGPSVNWAEIVPREGGGTMVLLGTSVGLVSSEVRDGRATVWQREGAETIGYAPVDMVDARSWDGAIAVATHGSGVFLAGASAPVTGDAGPAGPSTTLDLVYPNPLVASAPATVRFTLHRPSRVSIRVLDVRGREVARLDDRERAAGTYNVQWRAPVAAGVYIVEVRSDGRRQTKRVTVAGR